MDPFEQMLDLYLDDIRWIDQADRPTFGEWLLARVLIADQYEIDLHQEIEKKKKEKLDG